MLPGLVLGRLFTWCREAEISADRAGLLCCDEPRAAYGAVMRLQHGLNGNSPWMDPDREFDARAVIRSFRDWQSEPFVRFVLYLKQQPLDHPYYQERLAALKQWVDSGAYQKLRDRPASDAAERLVEVVKLQLFELAPAGQSVDPYVIASDGTRPLLRTKYASGVRHAEWKDIRPTDRLVDQPRAFRDGQPLFFEIWDADFGDDSFIGGFVIYPNGRDAPEGKEGEQVARYEAPIRWDWRDRRLTARPGLARVWIRLSQRAAVPAAGVDGGSGK
jgi:hypothetical protein